MSRIFLSYRRDDSAGYAGRLYDRLNKHFGQDQIFMDIDAIDPGLDFVEVIQKAVGSCDVLIALIGTRWLTATDAQGQRRLDDPEDFVRLEIKTALDRNIRVIPTLIRGATVPQPQDLPDGLKELSRRNAIEISDTRFNEDVNRLTNTIDEVLGVPKFTPRRLSARLWAGIGVSVLVVIIGALAFFAGRSGGPGEEVNPAAIAATERPQVEAEAATDTSTTTPGPTNTPKPPTNTAVSSRNTPTRVPTSTNTPKPPTNTPTPTPSFEFVCSKVNNGHAFDGGLLLGCENFVYYALYPDHHIEKVTLTEAEAQGSRKTYCGAGSDNPHLEWGLNVAYCKAREQYKSLGNAQPYVENPNITFEDEVINFNGEFGGLQKIVVVGNRWDYGP